MLNVAMLSVVMASVVAPFKMASTLARKIGGGLAMFQDKQ
jgi:hypothetical protein